MSISSGLWDSSFLRIFIFSRTRTNMYNNNLFNHSQSVHFHENNTFKLKLSLFIFLIDKLIFSHYFVYFMALRQTQTDVLYGTLLDVAKNIFKNANFCHKRSSNIIVLQRYLKIKMVKQYFLGGIHKLRRQEGVGGWSVKCLL